MRAAHVRARGRRHYEVGGVAVADISSESVRRAIEEFDGLGREAFLEKYGFGRSRSYFLVNDGKQYDAKALLGAAHGFARPDLGPLANTQFSGGEINTARKLRALGFTVEQIHAEPDMDIPIRAAMQRVLDLQTEWASTNTPAMAERGTLIRQ